VTWYTVETSNILLTSVHYNLLDGLLVISLSQVNYVGNMLGCLLDLYFVSSPDCVCKTRTSTITLSEDPHHPMLELTIGTGTKLNKISEKSDK